MKFHFTNRILSTLFVVVALLNLSCTNDDEPTPNPTEELTKIGEGYTAGIKVEIWAYQQLFAGYNKVQVALYDSITNERITSTQVTLNPSMDMMTMQHGCPVENPGKAASSSLYPGAILFTMPSGEMGTWSVEVVVNSSNGTLLGGVEIPVTVENRMPAEVVVFQDANTGQRYYLGYSFNNGKKVGVNDVEIIAFTFANDAFVPAENLTIGLSPEMPSMDHGSPNNVDPVHVSDGHYHGKVNFTMTGEWRMNLELKEGDTSLGVKAFDLIVN